MLISRFPIIIYIYIHMYNIPIKCLVIFINPGPHSHSGTHTLSLLRHRRVTWFGVWAAKSCELRRSKKARGVSVDQWFLPIRWVCKVYIIEGSLEVKLPTIWTDEKQSREEAERRERSEERRVEEKESEESRCRCAKR